MSFKSFDQYLLENRMSSVFDINKMSRSELICVLETICRDDVNESVLRKIFGAATGIVLGRKIMKILLKILNIKSGPLYNILTSKTVLARVGYEFGKK